MTTDVADKTETIDTTAELQQIDAGLAENNDAPVGDAEPAKQSDAAEAEAQSEAPKDEQTFESGKDYAEAKRKERRSGKPEAEQPQSRVDPNAVAEALKTYQNNLDARYKQVDELNIEEYNLYTEAGLKKFREDVKQLINSTHADAKQFVGYQAAQEAGLQVVESVQAGLAEALSADGAKAVQEQMQAIAAEGKPVTWGDYHRLTRDQAIAEYRESKEYLDEIAQSFDDGRALAERTKDSAQSGRTPGGATAGGTESGGFLVTDSQGQIDSASSLARIDSTPLRR